MSKEEQRISMIKELFTTDSARLSAFKWDRTLQLIKVLAYIIGTLAGTAPYLVKLLEMF